VSGLVVAVSIFIAFIFLMLWESERGMRKHYEELYKQELEHNKKLFNTLMDKKLKGAAK